MWDQPFLACMSVLTADYAKQLCVPVVLQKRIQALPIDLTINVLHPSPLLIPLHCSPSTKYPCAYNESGVGASMARAIAGNTVFYNLHQPSLVHSQ